MLDKKNLNNKVYLEGTICNSVRQSYCKDTNEQYIYFVLMVKRQGYPVIYNKEPYDYFFCYISERLMGGEFLDKIKSEFRMYDNVRVYGMLDNMPNVNSDFKQVNYRATHCYLSAINVIDIKPSENLKPNTDREIVIINNLRKTFGNDIKVTFSEDAFDKDYNGIEDDDLPNY